MANNSNQKQNEELIRKIVMWLRYIFIAAALIGLVDSLLFASSPDAGLGGFVLFLVWPLLAIVLLASLNPWEKRSKNPYIPLVIYLLFAGEAVDYLWDVVKRVLGSIF